MGRQEDDEAELFFDGRSLLLPPEELSLFVPPEDESLFDGSLLDDSPLEDDESLLDPSALDLDRDPASFL